jgi:hypothetical protein
MTAIDLLLIVLPGDVAGQGYPGNLGSMSLFST